MTELETLLAHPPFSLGKAQKAEVFSAILSKLTAHHYQHCAAYKKILDSLRVDPALKQPAEHTPFLPVRMFKDFELKSIEPAAIQKTMTSSGTTGQNVSKIFLDKATATHQTKVLSKIVSDLIGPKRLPMLIIDSREAVKSRNVFSARGAGILGFSMFGRDVTYSLDANMQLDLPTVEAFAEKYAGNPVFIFGFTSIIYQHFIKSLQNMQKPLALDSAILLHGGGWKKLADIAVNNEVYKKMLADVAGISSVHNYYGMVEQTGSIFTECSAGHLHSSIFSDIIVRRTDLSPANFGEQGLVQLVSLLPKSYPGHSILTEDMGTLIGEDDCNCGRLGRYFHIHGRAQQAEVRGCSDTYAA